MMILVISGLPRGYSLSVAGCWNNSTDNPYYCRYAPSNLAITYLMTQTPNLLAMTGSYWRKSYFAAKIVLVIIGNVIDIVFITAIIIFIVCPNVIVKCPVITRRITPGRQTKTRRRLAHKFVVGNLITLPVKHIAVVLFTMRLSGIDGNGTNACIPASPKVNA